MFGVLFYLLCIVVLYLLRVPVIVRNDLDMRIEKFQKTVIASNENVTKFHKKMNLSRLFVTTMEAFSQYGIIIFYFYDEKLKFGSLSIFEELFCCEENPDLTKMQTILENLHLWCEIKSNCFDVWKWMKENLSQCVL